MKSLSLLLVSACLAMLPPVSSPAKADADRLSSVALHGLRTGPRNSGRLHRIMSCTAGRLTVSNFEIMDICTAVPESSLVALLA